MTDVLIKVEPQVNSSFSTKLEGLQLAWDSTSLGALKTCPTYYNYAIRHGYQLEGDNVHLKFGILVHSSFEFYDRLRAKGVTYDDAVRETVKAALGWTWDEVLNRPWTSESPNKNRESLIRTIVWYLDQFKDDPLQTIILADGNPCVELSFRFELGEIAQETGETFLMCGHLDKLVSWQDHAWIKDVKTTQGNIGQDFFLKFSPDNQVSLYSFAGKLIYKEPVSGLIIDAAQIGATFSRFQRGIISRTSSQTDEWYKDALFWLRLAEHFARTNYWPQNDKACGIPRINEKTGEIQYGCEFRRICGAAPEVRQTLLDRLYKKRIWDPLQVRVG